MNPVDRPVAWVLDRSSSLFVAVIRNRIAAGDAPIPLAIVRKYDDLLLATIRWPVESPHADLCLPVRP